VIPRVVYQYILDIGALIHIKGVVEFIKVADLRGVHHEFEGNGTVLIIGVARYRHLQTIFVNYDVRYSIPFFLSMYSEDLSKGL